MNAGTIAAQGRPWVLADTNAWIDFIRDRYPHLRELIRASRVIGHSAIVGELTLGCGERSAKLAEFVLTLPTIDELKFGDVREFAIQAKLACCGIGWCDSCLLADCASMNGAIQLLTGDQTLRAAARRLGVSYD